MSNSQTSDLEAQPLTDLEQPLQELRAEEAEDVAGGIRMIYRPKRSEAEATDDSTESISLNFTKIE